MSRQKEKKIKRLRKKRIWPSMVFLFVFAAAVINSVFGITGLCLTNMMAIKLEHSDENTKIIAGILTEKMPGNQEEMGIFLEELQRMMPNVLDICIMDREQNVIMKSGDSEPGMDSELILSDFLGTSLFFTGEVDSTQYAEKYGESITPSEFLKYFTSTNEEGVSENETLFHAKIWLGYPVTDDKCVFVKNMIDIKESELGSVVLALFIIVVLLCAFVVYYIIFILGLVRDQRRITELLYLNPVTGGKNWSYLKTKGEKFIKKRLRYNVNYAMIHIRMNKYQSFCTCYGAKEGNDLLEFIYNELQTKLKKKEIAVHYARADYAVLLSYKSKEELEQRLNEMITELGATRQKQRLDFCAGIYEIEGLNMDMDAMYNNASAARSALHIDNDECIGWYNQEMQKQQLWERKVEDTMEDAMEKKEFHVYLQPKYSSKEGKLSGAEALVRWISPEEGFVPPNRFIPIFEKNGFILKLDDYMISEVARQQAQWIKEGKAVVPISVNVSRAHFTKDDLAEHICRLVDAYQVPHDVIELELTESAFFEDKEVLLETVRKLREFGFAVSMDDFGAGYSSLNSLKELPLDVIKLDAEFFRGIEDTEKGKIIVNEAICLAKRLDMKIVAEGIETKEQVDFLAEQGCDLIQGYYFAKPMPVNEFEERAFS